MKPKELLGLRDCVEEMAEGVRTSWSAMEQCSTKYTRAHIFMYAAELLLL